MFTLSNLQPKDGATKKRKRVGRGPGSGHGKTSTKGHKGQLARSGGGKGPGFEGGQMPLYRRVPKRGFQNPFKRVYEIVNLRQIDKYFNENETVTPETLRKKGLVKGNLPVKILGDGELTKKLNFEAHKFSKNAEEKIKKIGGTIKIIT